MARASRVGAVLLLLLWATLCFGNAEHVRENAANLSMRDAAYLADETFVQGSMIGAARSWSLFAVVGLTLALGALALRGSVRLRAIAVALAGTLAGTLAWRAHSDSLDWRQMGFVEENASLSLRGAPPPRAAAAPRAGAAPDLAGAPIVSFGRAGTNVLLVMLEGVSGAYVEPIAAANGHAPGAIAMPELGRIAREHVMFTSFIAQQRQTNRGEYALLCGELPRLVSAEPKMSEIAALAPDRRGKRCLPAALAEAGYATAYLQAAPLAFMLKDRFMPAIGFERTLGDSYFESAYSRSKWGVDDRAFFEQSLTLIDELRAGGRPWFLALLTSGTHHPVNVPEAALRAARASRRAAAFAYLDAAVGKFATELARRGVLGDTLLLLTSDESQGWQSGVDDAQVRLAQSWGFLIALLPGGERLQVDTPQAQLDVALSTLDWLGLADYAHGFAGRSVFRRYEQPRSLAFGNTYLRRVGGIDPHGRLVLCDEAFERCASAAADEQRLFRAGLRTQPAARASDAAFLRELVAESMPISRAEPRAARASAERAPRVLRLSDARRFSIRDDVDDLQWIFGGQYLSVPARSRIDVELDVALEVARDAGRDAASGWGRVELQHALTAHDTDFFAEKLLGMRPGDRFRARYSYITAEPLAGLESYLVVTRRAGGGLALAIERAQLRIEAASSAQRSELVVHERALEQVVASGARRAER